MKWFSLFILMLALCAVSRANPVQRLIRQGTVRFPKITIKRDNIIVHGNCNKCNVRTTHNSAHLTMKWP
ncbi:uncharacterized protein LOC115634321 [Scaptodrosophila lebanonensis]|uniref:Uncharacterized protein LOC115634321 n=1 Tax=Drosophila lebanonensis TaxID=7225 RepID=A0A6J2UI63_DROLE|nr:uncharacterized protein LOC115634321 [Scaptodrosophila lebanonensis]